MRLSVEAVCPPAARALSVAVVLFAISASGAGAAPPLQSGFFRLSRVQVEKSSSVLSFSVTVSHVPAGDRATLSWSLAPTGGAPCENAGYPGGTQSRNGLVVWDEQGPTFRWDRGTTGRCAGTVSVVAENQYEHCTAKVAVTPLEAKSAAPACALGGYAIGFSTLPVPAEVFQAYGRIRAELGTPPASAGKAAQLIRKALQAQTAAVALFPPVWFCDFQRTFTPIVALRTDLARSATDASVRDARAADRALSSCAPAPVRTAFDRLAASAKPSVSVLTATLQHYFPAVFGFRYSDLVDRIAAENAALAAAETAAAAGDSAAASRQVAAAARSAGAISAGLDHYQRGVVRVENAHG